MDGWMDFLPNYRPHIKNHFLPRREHDSYCYGYALLAVRKIINFCCDSRMKHTHRYCVDKLQSEQVVRTVTIGPWFKKESVKMSAGIRFSSVSGSSEHVNGSSDLLNSNPCPRMFLSISTGKFYVLF
jgi:hypothetical protein